jgi:uncharacterized protein YidB (DUF937 family)
VLGKKKTSTSSGGMPDLSGLGGLGSLLGGNGTSVLTALLPLLAGGGLTNILGRLQGGPSANKLASWVGTGPNDELAPDEVESVLGADQVAQIASSSGVSHDEAKSQLAKLLPGVIDHVTPQGALPDASGLEAALGKLSRVGG